MADQSKKVWGRRKFMQSSLLGAGALYLPNQLASMPNIIQKRQSSDVIRLGYIGLGRRCMNLLYGLLPFEGVEVVAGADVYEVKRQRFKQRADKFYEEQGSKLRIDVYEDYQDILNRDDIDAVVIVSPDHWHAKMAIDACRAKKDIYIEKPLTFTIYEGQQLVKAVRENKIILAVGSQQRSSANFQHAVKMVQKGMIGDIEKINAYVGDGPKPFNLPKQPIPQGLNWDKWLGPLDADIHFNEELNPPISLNPVKDEKLWGGWRWYKETGGGLTTDWGAHMFDIGQWGLTMDREGPVKIIPPGHEDCSALTFEYANGVRMEQAPFNEKQTKGVKFTGKEGWIEVARGYYKASHPELNFVESGPTKGLPYKEQQPHYYDFVQSVQRRKDPFVTVEIGHNTCTTCTLGNIAYELDRPLLWNDKEERFDNDYEASTYLHRSYRPGYTL